MATNQALRDAHAISYPAPATVVSNDPVLVGMLAGVAKTSYRADTGEASIQHDGAHWFNVTAASALSPLVGAALMPGDPIYAVGGVLDPTTNFTTGFTLCADPSGIFFGNILDTLGAGLTASRRVRLALGGKDY